MTQDCVNVVLGLLTALSPIQPSTSYHAILSQRPYAMNAHLLLMSQDSMPQPIPFTLDRGPRIQIVKNAGPFPTLYPFVAQDLYLAQHDPADPNGDLLVHAWYVLRQFREKHGGRNPQTDLEYAVAVTDWVSSNLRHPAFYPENPYLPRFYRQMTPDPLYLTLNWEPVRIINYSLNHDPNNPLSWPSPQCTMQNFAAAGLLNYFGLHARLVDVEGHTGLEYYSFKYHKWVWCDSTFNEHYTMINSDIPLGVRELNTLTLEGMTGQINVMKHGYPTSLYPENTYIIVLPHGFRQYAPTLYMNIFNRHGANLNRTHTVVYSPDPPPTYRPFPNEIIHYEDSPDYSGWYQWSETNDPSSLDVPLDALSITDAISWDFGSRLLSLSVTSYLPYTTHFEQWSELSQMWENIAMVERPKSMAQTSPELILTFGVGTYTVRLRAGDNVGNHTQEVSFIID